MAQVKERVLYLREILLRETDKEHPLTAEQLLDMLENLTGERADRKTIYRDITSLRTCGMDIHLSKSQVPGYYVGARTFDLAELKLLVDAVSSSKFISESMTEGLVRRIESLTSRYQAGVLQRQVYILHRAKTQSDTVLENVDAIHQAIHENRQISFCYAEWTAKKQLRIRHDGRPYVVSPWALVWEDENYYLVSYSKEARAIRHYRVDKMKQVCVLKNSREGEYAFRSFDLPAYTKKTFGMFGGEDAHVCLRCANELAGVIIDRFGREVMMIPDGDSHFRVHVTVAVSRQFFGWAAGIGEQMQIASPRRVAEQYTAYLRSLLQTYEAAEAPQKSTQ